MAELVKPEDLCGPRSFFTDIDPMDPDYRPSEIIRKLKLQLLTKKMVVIPASSLFHEIGHELFVESSGLDQFLESGVILPAIRDEFTSPREFFDLMKDYSRKSADYFSPRTSAFLSWSLRDNSSWFTEKFLSGLTDTNSLLREKAGIESSEAERFASDLRQEVTRFSQQPFLTRELISEHTTRFGSAQSELIGSYANLVYRLSGTRVVNCEGHFPQSNLTRLGIAGNEECVSDESIFWDIYVEAVMSYLNSAIRMTPERLDRLSFGDILELRNKLSLHDFSETYDQIISQAKQDISISDPEGVILRQHELSQAAKSLRAEFDNRVKSEMPETSTNASALWEVANVLSLVANPNIGLIVGCVSAVKALPEITALVSKSLADAIRDRLTWVKKFVNSRLGWSDASRRAPLDAYRELIAHGLPSS